MTLVRRSHARSHEIQLTRLAFSSLAFLSTLGERREGEGWCILLDEETFTALESERYSDESNSNCILRLARKGDPSQILQPSVQRLSLTLDEAKFFGVIPVLRLTGRGKSRKSKGFHTERWWCEVSPKLANQIQAYREKRREEFELARRAQARTRISLKKGIDN